MNRSLRTIIDHSLSRGYVCKIHLYDYDWLKQIRIRDKKGDNYVVYDTPDMGFVIGSRDESDYKQPKVNSLKIPHFIKLIDDKIAEIER